jgi:hypothetical protein
VVEDGEHRSVRCVIVKDGKEAEGQDFALPNALIGNNPIRLRVQMVFDLLLGPYLDDFSVLLWIAGIILK